EVTPGKQPVKIKVHPKRSRYGFLPGYRQPPALSDWRAQNRISAARSEWRFYGWDGQPRYGFGYPGYFRGRDKGGSFGAVRTTSPGPMPRAVASAGLIVIASRPAILPPALTGPQSIWLCRRSRGWLETRCSG